MTKCTSPASIGRRVLLALIWNWSTPTGVVIPGKSIARVEQVETVFGLSKIQVAGRKLAAFFHQHHVAAGDSLLFTVEQFDPPRWRVEHEPQAQRDKASIDRRNRELMDTSFCHAGNGAAGIYRCKCLGAQRTTPGALTRMAIQATRGWMPCMPTGAWG